jgi:flavodoxin
MADTKTLVVYYSRGGTTRAAAEELARALGGADLEEIRDTADRSGWRGYLLSFREAVHRSTVVLASLGREVSDYDLVVVGTPVWVSAVSSPVRSYLNAHVGEFRRIAFFLTHGGTGRDKVFAQMTRLAGRQPEAVLAIRETEMPQQVLGSKVAAFANELRGKLAAASRTAEEGALMW